MLSIPGHVIDKVRLAKVYHRFHDAMKDNRKNTSDGKIALSLLGEVEKHGIPTRTTERKMLAWCHTNGNSFQDRVPLAREIAMVLYGRVPTKDEVG